MPSIKYNRTHLLLTISVFTSNIFNINIANFNFDSFAYTFYILYFLKNIFNLQWKKVLLIFLVLGIASLISILTLNLNSVRFASTFFPTFLIYLVVFSIVSKAKNYDDLFKLYVKICFYTAIFGIIQYFASLVGISLLNNIPGRINSVSGEPSHYACILLPAMVYAFFNFKQMKLYFIVFLIANILTFNLTAYIVFILAVGLAYVNLIYLFLSAFAIYFLITKVLVNINDNFKIRILETKQVLEGGIDYLSKDLKVNGTTLSMFSNIEVAKKTIEQSPFFGSGFGGNGEMYMRTFQNSAFRYNYYYGLNANSAHNLLIRVFSEMGLVGGCTLFYLYIKTILVSKTSKYKVVLLSCLAHFFCKSIKLGSYIDFGTPFFFSIIICCIFIKKND